MGSSFHRGLTVCDLVPSPDGWEWLPFVAVDDQHPLYGHHFVVLESGHTLSHVVHVTGLAAHDARWWYAVDSRGVSDEDAALRKLLIVSDELTKMDGTC